MVSPCTPDFSPGEICILCGNVPRAVIQKSQVEVALPFLTKLQMSHGVTSAVFCWWKHSQAHPDLRGGDTDLTSQWKKYRRIWSYILKQPHGIMLWQYMCFLCCVQPCPTLCNPLDCSSPGFSIHGDSPAKNTEVARHALLQGVFPTLESNQGLLHCRQIVYQLSYQGRSPNC